MWSTWNRWLSQVDFKYPIFPPYSRYSEDGNVKLFLDLKYIENVLFFNKIKLKFKVLKGGVKYCISADVWCSAVGEVETGISVG
jgi:hypothetical protein